MSLAKAAEVLKAPLTGADRKFSGVSTDTRTLSPGDLFVALEGPNHDGHHFIATAAQAGAAGVLLSRSTQTTLPSIKVLDTLSALGTLAAAWRRRFDIPVIAITGSKISSLAETGVAVINADDKYADFWRDLASPRRCLTFGLDNDADITSDYQTDTSGSLVRIQTTYGDIDMRLPLLGKHNVSNALAATASSIAAGAELDHVKRGLEKLRCISGRLEIKPGLNGARVIDDTYNANPASLTAGIAVLKEFPGGAVLVIGDMAELGSAAPDIHRRVGQLAKRLGISRLFAIGALSKLAVDSFGEGGMHFSSRRELVEALLHHLNADTTVLVKGSRVMRLEHVVQKITQTDTLDTHETNAN